MAVFPTGTPVGLLAGQVIDPSRVQVPDGSAATLALTRQGALLVAEQAGKHFNASQRGVAFMGCTNLVTPVIFSSTAPTMILFNPVASGKNIEVTSICLVPGTANTTTDEYVIGYTAGTAGAAATTPGTNLAVQMPLGGQNRQQPVGIFSAAATVVAPSLLYALGTLGTTAATGLNLNNGILWMPDGTLVLGPNSLIVGGILTTQTVGTCIWSASWNEWPI